MTTPIGTEIRVSFESMWYAMIELFFIWIRLGIGFTDAFRDHLGETVFMASILAILALHTSSIFEKLATEGTTHNAVELLSHKFMAVQFLYFFFPLSHCTLAVKADIKWSPVLALFRYDTLACRPEAFHGQNY